MKHGKCDVFVIGAGPAGMAAAIGAREAGAGKVLLADREMFLGGILQQCIHPGFGLKIFNSELTGPEFAHRYISKLERSGVECLLDSTIMEISHTGKVTVSSAEYGIHCIQANAIVLAMGCRERTRAQSGIPGFRPAGVFTAGTAQRLINIDGLLVGRQAVIVGSGDIGLIMARRCTMEGMEVRAVIEKLTFPSGLNRNVQQCVRDFQIPLHLDNSLTFIEGKSRVSGVRFGKGDGRGKESSIGCDTVLFSVGLIPEIELVRQLNITLDERTGGPVVDNGMQTLTEGVFACGNLVQVYDLVDWVSADGEWAGRNAALFAMGALKAPEKSVRIEAGTHIRSVVPQIFRSYPGAVGEDVKVYVRVEKVLRNPVFVLKNGSSVVTTIKKPYAVPQEMVSLNIARYLCTLPRSEVLRIDGEEGQREEEPDDTVGKFALSRSSGLSRIPGTSRSSGLNHDSGGDPLTETEVICVVCPYSCSVRIHAQGETLYTEGTRCTRGIDYALREATDPRRIFTSTVRVRHGEIRMLSVRSTKPIRKGEWKRAMEITSDIEINAPVFCGQIVVKDFLEDGIDLVATKDVTCGERMRE
jgi:CxxC motif-containing protein/NADPH-dependent 2,4-dienoyl-CoA reductase/sulfur reductase-like enzyme